MPNRHDIHVLNTLITATLDSAERLDQIAGDSESTGHGSLFTALATERRDMARDLSETVTALGGHPDDAGGSILAKAQRAVMDIGHALIRDEAGLVDAADRGEAALDRRYTYYDPIATLPESGQAWWAEREHDPVAAELRAVASRAASAADLLA